MSHMQEVILNRDLFTHILSYLEQKQLKKLFPRLKNNVHYDYICPTTHTLIYGQVQSGKTHKIMNYIKHYKRDYTKILIIQNSILILKQYIINLMKNNITFKIINKTSVKDTYNNEQVLITLTNKFRINYLMKYLKTNKYIIKNYCLVLDESDQYIKRISKYSLFKEAKNILHVTATPFVFNKKFMLDNMSSIDIKENYIGINNVDITEIQVIKITEQHSYFTRLKECVYSIIANDFMLKQEGIMLITCFNKILDMKGEAGRISLIHPKAIVIVISSVIGVYINGVLRMKIKNKNLQKLFDHFRGHVILIANRLSNRGFNYTNSTYTKHLTHQISVSSDDHTNFLQKCRIFGLRPTDSVKPMLYCIVNKAEHIGYTNTLKNKINKISQKLNKKMEQEAKDETPSIKLTIKVLKKMCKENKIKRYSKLRKQELVDLLENNGIKIQ